MRSALLLVLLAVPAAAFDFGKPFELSWSPGGVAVKELEAREGGKPQTGRVKAEWKGGGLALSGFGADDDALPALQKAFDECLVGYAPGAFQMLGLCLKALRAQAAPELRQTAYESSAAFVARAAAAKAAQAKRAAEALPATFLVVFGDPMIGNVVYDPDSRAFIFDLGCGRGGFKLRMALKDPIPNKDAQQMFMWLVYGKPALTFRVEDGAFTLESARVTVSDNGVEKTYEAVPADAVVARFRVPADVDQDAGKEGSFGFAQSRELLAKKKELEEAREQRATEAQIAALEAQIKALSPQDSEIVSDVDAAVAPSPADPSAYAVVVGVESYQMKDLPKARFAERDARSMAKRLEALGVPPRNMKVLIGSGATRAKVAAVLEEWLPQKAGSGSKVYFYFSGHGAPDAASGDSYLVPWDGDPSLLKATGYRVSALYASLEKLPASKRVAVLDACFSGAGGRSLLAKGARPLVTVKEGDAGTVTVLAAASSSQITATLESQGHGLFTYHFLKALGAGGRPASSVYAELKPKVEDDAARQSREQTPAFRGPDAQIP